MTSLLALRRGALGRWQGEEALLPLVRQVFLAFYALSLVGALAQGVAELVHGRGLLVVPAVAVLWLVALHRHGAGRIGCVSTGLEAAALLVVVQQIGLAGATGTLYVGLLLRALYGTAPRVLVGTASYLVALVSATLLEGLPLAAAQLSAHLPGFLVASTAMHLTGRVLQHHEEGSARRFQAMVTSSSDVIAVAARDTTLTYVSPAAQAVLGRAAGQLVGERVLDWLDEPDAARLQACLRAATSGAREAQRLQCSVAVDGRRRSLDLTVQDLLDDPAVRGLVLSLRDVSDRQALLEELRHQASHDALTGLGNRTLFRAELEEALVRPGARLAVMVLDLDRFKEVNDTLGHHVGDLLLCQVAERLRAALPERAVVARMGGDEFAVLLCAEGHADVAAHAEGVAAGLADALSAPFELDGVVLVVEASTGIVLGQDGEDAQLLLQHADVAMYDAKDSRRASAVYDPTSDANTPQRLALLGDLRRALTVPGELRLHYQPKVDVRSGAVHSLEALLRWQHPTRGLVPPDAFIPVAETTGAIGPLTETVLRLALAQQRRWLDAGRARPVAVNISARTLLDAAFPDLVCALLAEHGVPARLLLLELTESTIMADPPVARQVLQRLRDLGVRLSLDDFGTGYSSMAYLKDLPVTELKIDRSFVLGMARDRSNGVLIQSAVDLGHNLGLVVVAEGVEDAGSLHRLRVMGCDLAQGYHLCRPLPADEVDAWLEAYAARRTYEVGSQELRASSV